MSDLLAAVLIIAGCIFCLVSAVGIVRLPDTLIRMHASTKAGSLGAGLILASVAVYSGEMGTVLKALLTLMFLYLTAPVAAHLAGRAAYRSGIQLSERTWVDHLREDMQAGRSRVKPPQTGGRSSDPD